MKIYVVGGDTYYANFIKNCELTDKLTDADIVMFTGGEDVDPALYGCRQHPKTFTNKSRDLEEKKVFESINPSQLVVSVCRGSQFTCVMNGGLLVQDCANHAIWGTHAITDGEMVYEITSTHHQMQYPYNLDPDDYDVLFTSYNNSSEYYDGDKINPNDLEKHGEPEIVLYHKEGLPRCLAIQGHPEMIPESPVANMLSNLINNLANENK